MECEKCGQRLETYWKYCPHCNTPIAGEKKSDPKDYSTILIVVFFAGIVFTLYFSNGAGFLVSMAAIITARIKYPQNDVIAAVFLISVLAMIFYWIALIMLVTICIDGMRQCS